MANPEIQINEKKVGGIYLIEMGKYSIQHPLFFIAKPHLLFIKTDSEAKIDGVLLWLGRKIPLQLVHEKKDELIFLLPIKTVPVELVLHFDKHCFQGFLDTPIGHYRFLGRKTREKKRGNASHFLH